MNTNGAVKAMIPTKVPPIIPRAALFRVLLADEDVAVARTLTMLSLFRQVAW